MVGDITYIPTWEGWVYLATVIDCHTKAVIGWAMGDNYQTPLIEQAIRMAARNYPLKSGAIFHSDRGSNYQCHLVNPVCAGEAPLACCSTRVGARPFRLCRLLGVGRCCMTVESLFSAGRDSFVTSF